MELELLAADGASSGEVGGLVADLQRGGGGRGDEAGGGECEQKSMHAGLPRIFKIGSVGCLQPHVQKSEGATTSSGFASSRRGAR